MRWILGIALLGLATPAMAADQFDLVCNGGDVSFHYRVDLAKGEWCFGSCETVFKIPEVTSGTLTLMDKEPSGPRGDTIKNRINRATGEWYFYRSQPSIGFYKTVEGKCELAPFSGMTDVPTKF